MSMRAKLEFAERCRLVRCFLLQKPEATASDVASHFDEDIGGCLNHLSRMGLAEFEGGGRKGPARWTAVPLKPVKPEAVEADLSEEGEAE